MDESALGVGNVNISGKVGGDSNGPFQQARAVAAGPPFAQEFEGRRRGLGALLCLLRRAAGRNENKRNPNAESQSAQRKRRGKRDKRHGVIIEGVRSKSLRVEVFGCQRQKDQKQ